MVEACTQTDADWSIPPSTSTQHLPLPHATPSSPSPAAAADVLQQVEQQQKELIQEAAEDLGVKLLSPEPSKATSVARKHRGHKKIRPALDSNQTGGINTEHSRAVVDSGDKNSGGRESDASDGSSSSLPVLTPRTVSNMQALVAGVQVKIEELQVSPSYICSDRWSLRVLRNKVCWRKHFMIGGGNACENTGTAGELSHTHTYTLLSLPLKFVLGTVLCCHH